MDHFVADINKDNSSNVLEVCREYKTFIFPTTKPNYEIEKYDSTYKEHFQTTENTLIYPIEPGYEFAQTAWEKHQHRFWSTTELNPSDDLDSFSQLKPEFAKIFEEGVAYLKHGDDVVLDIIANNLLDTIKQPNIRAFFSFQQMSENGHKFMYSKMLDVSKRAEYLRSDEFVKDYMHEFTEFGYKYKTQDIRVVLFSISLTENLMFAPAFLILNYTKKLGYCKNSCTVNDFVMRDEYSHYDFSRKMLNVCKMKLDKKIAREMFFDMVDITKRLINRIIPKTYVSEDGLFDAKIAHDHFMYIACRFQRDNCLYNINYDHLKHFDSEKEYHDKHFKTSPAASYMGDVELNFKINYMESSSINYKPKGNCNSIDMNFNFKNHNFKKCVDV